MIRLLDVFGLLVVVAFVLWNLVARPFAGGWEGLRFPVTEGTQITMIEVHRPGWSRISGTSKRVRECSFESVDFYLGEPGASSRADLVFIEGTKVRGQGYFDFGPWDVQLTPDQLLNRTYAVVKHRCHRFWLTETVFYLGRVE